MSKQDQSHAINVNLDKAGRIPRKLVVVDHQLLQEMAADKILSHDHIKILNRTKLT